MRQGPVTAFDSSVATHTHTKDKEEGEEEDSKQSHTINGWLNNGYGVFSADKPACR